MGVERVVPAQPRVPQCGRFAVLAEDDTVIGEAPTISQEARLARRLVLVSGRSGREGVESQQPERSGHVDADPVRPSVAAQRVGFGQLDFWDISEVFSCRASVMRTVPRFLWGSFRVALKVAFEEIRVGQH